MILPRGDSAYKKKISDYNIYEYVALARWQTFRSKTGNNIPATSGRELS